MRTRNLVSSSALVGLLVAGCGSASSSPGDDDRVGGSAPITTPTSMPTAVPAADGPVRSRGLTTILAKGDAPAELCLGGVAESLPPQCSGPEIVGWDWGEHLGTFEDVRGVRWGGYAVTGTFDGKRFRLTNAIASALYDPAASDPGAEPDFSTPCAEPAGGWRVLDPAKTTDRTMDATFVAAEKLPGYAESWVDRSRNPSDSSVDPASTTINVKVTGDIADAEAELRRLWGGALCITTAAHSQRELQAIQDRLNELPGMLSSGPEHDVMAVQVVYDDGSFQAWADATYGPGLVQISSVLVPASD